MINIKTVEERNFFKPYGVELPPINSTDNRIKYTGQERDTFTNYDYMHARFYSSSIGRFLRPDPINGTVENPQSWNLYSYVRNNPVNATDPTGLAAVGMQSFAYMTNLSAGSAFWLDTGAYMSFYSSLHGGNIAGGPGSGGMAWVTTTYSSTLNTYIEGNFESSFDVSYSASYIVDLSTGEVVTGSWGYNGDVSISEGANNPATAHYLASPENIATMETSADAILANSRSSFEASVFLNIGMRETYLGVKDPLNPLALTGKRNGYRPSNTLEENVRLAMDVFRGNFSRTGDLLQSLIKYNGNPKMSNGKQVMDWYGSDVYRGYLEFLESMREASVYEPWRLGW